MTTLNWKDLQRAASESGFDALPAGEYDIVTEQSSAVKSQNGKDMIKTRFRVETGPYAGRAIFNQFVITPDNSNALNFFFRHMRVLGLDDAFFAANPSVEAVAAALVNRRARVRISIREWQGQERNQVDAVLPPSNGMSAASPPQAHTGPLPPGGMDHFRQQQQPPKPAPAPAPKAAPPAKPKIHSVPPPPPPPPPTQSPIDSIQPPDLPF